MKKKFINGLLLVALFVGFTGSMVSCKDYDDEKLTELDGRVAQLEKSLRQALADQKAELLAEIAKLQNALDECKSTCAAFREEVNNKFKLYVTLTELETKLGDYYTKNETYNRTEIENLITTSLSNYYTKAEIDDLLKNLDLSKYAEKTWVEGKIAELKNYVDEELKKYVQASALEQTIVDMLSNSEGKLYKALETYFLNNKAITDYIEGVAEAAGQKYYAQAVIYIDQQIREVNAELATVKKTAEDALQLAGENKEKISELDEELGNLSEIVGILGDLLEQVSDIANEAKAKAEANSKLIENLQTLYGELKGQVDGIDSKLNILRDEFDQAVEDLAGLAEEVAANKAEADQLHSEMLETISGLASAIDENAQTIGQVKSDLETLAEEVADQIQGLQTQIDTANEKILANTQAIEKLAGLFKNVMAKWITGIELNGTYNPMFGEFALPFDIRSNMLVAFHGTIGDYGYEFPTNRQAYYALPEAQQWNKITDEDITMIGDLKDVPGYDEKPGNVTIINNDGAEGNAGTLYLTINPTNRDFTGTKFELIDSKNNVSVVELSDLKKSDHTLYFGYTRGGVEDEQSPNGFYEAKATYTAEDLNSTNRLNLDIESLKDVMKDLKEYEDGFDLHNLTEAVYNNVSKILIQNAVKATWTDETGVKSVVSQYGIGATSIKPLGFAFAKDVKVTQVPGLGMAEDFIDRLLDKAAAGFPELRFIDYEVEDIVFEKLEDLNGDGEVNPNTIVATFHIHLTTRHIVSIGPKTVSVEIPEWYAYDEEGKMHTIYPHDPMVTIYMEGSGNDVDITLSYDISDELYRLGQYYTEPEENIRKQIEMYLDDIRDFINDLADIKPSKIVDNAKSEITKYFNEIFKRYKRYLVPNKYVRPMLLVKSEDGYRRLSRTAKKPATIKGTDLLLMATTYTAEIISPAYKKFIAVTNVSKDGVSAKGGDATCKQILDKANEQDCIKEVIFGGFGPHIEFQAESGYTYEVLYSALDYTGQVFTEKYYFTVK